MENKKEDFCSELNCSDESTIADLIQEGFTSGTFDDEIDGIAYGVS